MDRPPHLLLVDDDREILSLLSLFLAKHGCRVSTARDGVEMWKQLKHAEIDLVVLDLMLPGEDGLSLCRRLRAGSATPVIMLTAMGEETDRIVGLEIGADDYLPKPFNPRELLARIKAVLRRTAARTGGRAGGPAAPEGPRPPRRILAFAGWQLDATQRELRDAAGEAVPLSAGEFDLLLAFAENPQQVLTRDRLLDLARGRSAVPFDRSIDVQVSRLRRKIEPDPAEPTLIKTVRGGGYLFTPAVAVAA
ncbi:MAG: response regulator [Dongiaceae bacterium]